MWVGCKPRDYMWTHGGKWVVKGSDSPTTMRLTVLEAHTMMMTLSGAKIISTKNDNNTFVPRLSPTEKGQDPLQFVVGVILLEREETTRAQGY